jgi:hypothetical protein
MDNPEKITVQFCSSFEEGEGLYEEINDMLEIYYESEHISEAEFEREPDSELCRALHINVQKKFREKLVNDIVDILDEDHGCDTVVLENEEESIVSGECTITQK